MVPAKSSYIPTLDGWRALAIAGVILSHSFPSDFWTRHGALGVNLFFAISGFLITARLLDEHDRCGAISLRRFYLRRAFRILPPALFYLAVIGGLTAAGVLYSSGADILSCLVFLRDYWGADARHGWYTGHFWSLSVEEQFYLFWPFLLVAVGMARARWLAPALALGFAIWRSADLRHGWVASFLHQESLRNFPLRGDYRMDALLWACALALFLHRRNPEKWIPAGWSAVLALGALAAAIGLNLRQPQGYMVAQALLFPLVILATTTNPATWLGILLESTILRWVGRLSYSLYLWQQPFFSQYHHGELQRFPVNLVLAIGCACLSFYAVERPLIRLGRRFSGAPMRKLERIPAADQVRDFSQPSPTLYSSVE